MKKATILKIRVENEVHKKYVSLKKARIYEIYRFDKTRHFHPWIQYYIFPKFKLAGMVLSELIKIHSEIDQSLGFRRSCREGICGSCAVNIDGINTLACIHKSMY